MENVALKIDDVSKDFMLPHEQVRSLKGLFVQPLRQLSGRRTETQHALRGLSFEVKKGEFFGVLGRNGSGKSTLLKIMAGVYQPTGGAVAVKGKLVPFIELGVGFNPELTGRENVYLNGALLGFSRREIDAQYDQIVAFAELQEFMDQRLKNYSSGMQVRLAFSVAVVADADILLVDEVLAVGDADFQRKCFQHFKTLKKNNKTVIFVSHDMNAVREYCDRAILINEGAITHQGDADNVANEYLRLFNAAASGDNRAGNRWGNEQVVFRTIEAELSPNAKSVIIRMGIQANQATADLVAGFRIKNSAGKLLTGANTTTTIPKNISLKKGEGAKLEWRLPNVLSGDVYSIDATLRLSDGVTFCDNWDDAAAFEVIRSEHTPYPIVPDIEVIFKKGMS